MKKQFTILLILIFNIFLLPNDVFAGDAPVINNVYPKILDTIDDIITIEGKNFSNIQGGKRVVCNGDLSSTLPSLEIINWSDALIKFKFGSEYYISYSGNKNNYKCKLDFYELNYQENTNIYTSDEFNISIKPNIKQIEYIGNNNQATIGDVVTIKGFLLGDIKGSATINNIPAEVISWSGSIIRIKIPKTESGNLIITTSDGNFSNSLYVNIKPIKLCTSFNWECKDWGECSSGGTQLRTCNKILNCEDGESPVTTQSCTKLEPQIQSISPTQGAVGDDVKIMLPYITSMFPKCWTGDELSAKIYFNNVEAGPMHLISNGASGGGTPVYAKVPPSATNGKIKVELTCNAVGYLGDNYEYKVINYSATLLSSSDFIVLLPAAQDDLSVRQQYLQQTKVDQAWNYTHGSSDVVVAVIDDGVYTGHPDLDSNMWINYDEIEGNGKDDDNNGYIDDKWGWDFISNLKDMTTLGTHGTMVAGIIGAEGNNNTGISGINWSIKLMPIIACNNNGCNSGAITNAIKYAVDNGADIINLSLAGQIFNYSDSFNEIIKYAFDRNVLVVIAAGNGDVEGGIGRNLNITKVSPVCNDGNDNMVLGVGAVDSNNKITSWSNYGDCVDIYAPGENIISTAVPAHSTLNGFYDTADGTSFSAPIVSGIAALIKAKYPTIKNTAIRDRIINNSDYQNGVKVVNAYKAISQPFTDSEKKTDNIISPTPITVAPTPMPAPTPSAPNINNIIEAPQIKSSVVEEEKKLTTKIDNGLSKRMNGNILLQVEKNGEGWYVYPDDKKKYYLGRPADAFSIMKNLGLGIKHSELTKYLNSKFSSTLSGKILLDVENNGEAYYVNPKDLKGYFLNRPADAFKVMRELGLGITNADIRKIGVGEIK